LPLAAITNTSPPADKRLLLKKARSLHDFLFLKRTLSLHRHGSDFIWLSQQTGMTF